MADGQHVLPPVRSPGGVPPETCAALARRFRRGGLVLNAVAEGADDGPPPPEPDPDEPVTRRRPASSGFRMAAAAIARMRAR